MVSLSDFGMNIDFGGIINSILTILVIVVILVVAIGVGFLLMKIKGKKSKKTQIKIGWWEEVNKNLVPSTMDDAKEIIVPGTRLRLFYLKSKDMWLPRFSKGVTKDLFYIVITPKRELVNFTLGSIQDDMEKAGLNYDHTDMNWAAENLREFVKRNYRDKSIPWWKAYQGAITTAIYIIILTFSAVVVLYFMKQLVGDIGSLIDKTGTLIERADNIIQGGSSSGITTT